MGGGGGGNLVDGLLRWLFFQRRPSSSSNTHDQIHNPDNLVDDADSKNPNDIVALDPSKLKQIKVPKRDHSPMDAQKKAIPNADFFTEYGEANRYQIQQVVGKGSYGVVGSAIDTPGERVAIKKINDVFDHISLLRLLLHPDVVQIKHIMLPPSRREFRDVYVVFELMESDLHQVIKANDDLTPEHHRFSSNVFHRDLKPKNILANADCKLKICDFGLARVSFDDAPLLSFGLLYQRSHANSTFAKTQYTPAIDIWSVGCIFAEMLLGKPLFPGKNVVHQLDIMTDFLGTPPPEAISKIRNDKARRYLGNMRKKQPVPFSKKFPKADPSALRLLQRLIAFDPKNRPSAEEALTDPYFNGVSSSEREPSTQPISKLEFEFERKKLTKDDVRELIYREILEYHPQMQEEYLRGGNELSFMYPSGVDRFRRQFAHLEENQGQAGRSNALQRQHASLPRERVPAPKNETAEESSNDTERRISAVVASTLHSPKASQQSEEGAENGGGYSARNLMKSASISGSKCIGVQSKVNIEDAIAEEQDKIVAEVVEKVATLHNT
ncbi:hypothetical protein Bca52824_097097 [Brassica carinata]|uniref:Protein kinase domain-containing protein n=1 Tax=Brassica carinata TaxID=52824 RepID=A0A8X7NYX2_BRACI|nr:hypothetical protein Bca52824_097097 [Brassica carinata]